MKKLRQCLLKSLIIVTLAGSTSFHNFTISQLPFYASSDNYNDPMTTINELLGQEQYLFLKSDLPLVDSRATIIINADSGQVLYSEDGDYPLDILSITKAMTAYVILDKLHEPNTNINWDTRIVAKGGPLLVSYEYSFSNVSLYEGNSYTIRELFEAMMITSANGATMLLAEYFAGSEKAFVGLMMEKAAELKLSNTSFKTTTGLSKSDVIEFGYDDLEDGNNQMSCEDVAFMTANLINDYPEILEFTSMTKSVFAAGTTYPFEYWTTNELLAGEYYEYEGVDGLKTGGDIPDYTSSIVLTAKQEDTRLIAVMLGARNSDARSVEAHKLLDFGFKNVYHETFVDRSEQIFEDGVVNVKYSNTRKLPVKLEKPFILSSSYSDLDPEIIFIPTNTKYNSTHDAFVGPIKKGEVLGKLVVKYSDLYFLTTTDAIDYHVDVIADADANNNFYLFNVFEWIGDWVYDLLY
jgi:D-alanyl-D-alanine carboxypeptidase